MLAVSGGKCRVTVAFQCLNDEHDEHSEGLGDLGFPELDEGEMSTDSPIQLHCNQL